jgi:PTH1 family peptidyl-tRNA hydrolase
VGLGNPGAEYEGTRHNVGFELIDRLAESARIRLYKSKHQARFGLGTLAETSVVLAKPLTYMNLSGRSVAPLMRDFGLTPARVLVLVDDLDLPLGKVRLRAKGSAGGHNGHKSLIAVLGTEEYPRIKIGIGRGEEDTVDFVLGRFSPEDRVDIDRAMREAAEMVHRVLTVGVERATT